MSYVNAHSSSTVVHNRHTAAISVADHTFFTHDRPRDCIVDPIDATSPWAAPKTFVEPDMIWQPEDP